MTKREQQRIRQLQAALRNKNAQQRNRKAAPQSKRPAKKSNKRAREFLNSNAGVRIPPIAVGKNIRASQGGQKRMSGTDFINVTTVPVAAKSGDVIAQPIITASSGTRLAQVTQMYQKWTPRTLSFEFSGTGATTTPGMLAAGFVRDPDEEVPTDSRFTLAWLMNQEGSIMFKNWSDGRITMNCNEKLYTSNSGSDKRFWSPGKLVIIAATGTGGQPVEVMVTMKWTVDVELPSNEVEINSAGPLSMTLTQDLRLKAEYFTETVGDNEDVHFAVWGPDQSAATLDPRTWSYSAFSLDNTNFSSLPDGAIIKASVPWTASYDFAIETPSIVISSPYMVVKKQMDAFNGSYNTHTEVKVNGLMPAWYIGGKLFIAGTVGASGSRLKAIGSDWALPSGTILTYMDPTLESMDETITMLEKGLYVTKPTGRTIWRRKDDDNGPPYVTNYTQADINRMPIVRVIGNNLGKGIPVDIASQENPITVVVKGDDTNSTPLAINVAQVGAVDVPTTNLGGTLAVALERGLGTASGDPLYVSSAVSNFPATQPISGSVAVSGSVSVSNFSDAPAIPSVVDVDIKQINGNPVATSGIGGALPIFKATGAPAMDVNLAEIKAEALTAANVPVSGSVSVSNFPTTQPISSSGTLDVNVKSVHGTELTVPVLPTNPQLYVGTSVPTLNHPDYYPSIGCRMANSGGQDVVKTAVPATMPVIISGGALYNPGGDGSNAAYLQFGTNTSPSKLLDLNASMIGSSAFDSQ